MPAYMARGWSSWALAALGGFLLTVPAPAQIWPPSLAKAKAKESPPTLGPSSAQYLLEGMLVELAWMADPQLFSFDLTTRVHHGVIEILGQVSSQAVREQALKVARQQASLPVIDRLQIQPNLVRPFTTRALETVQKEARDLLTQNFGEGASSIKAAADPQGIIFLTGTIGSYEDKVAASRHLRRVPGCICVVNQLIVATQNQEGRPFARITRDNQHMVIDERPSGVPKAPWLAGTRPPVEQVSLVQSPAVPVSPAPTIAQAEASPGVPAIITEELGNASPSSESARVNPTPIRTVTGTMVPYGQRQPLSSSMPQSAPVSSSGFRFRDWLFGGMTRPSPETRKAPIHYFQGGNSSRTTTGPEVTAANRTSTVPESSGTKMARSPVVLEIKDPGAQITASSERPLRYETRTGILPVKKEINNQSGEFPVVPALHTASEATGATPMPGPQPLPTPAARPVPPPLPLPMTTTVPLPVPLPPPTTVEAPLVVPPTPQPAPASQPLPVPATSNPVGSAPNYWSWNNAAPPASTTLPVMKPTPITHRTAPASFPLMTSRPEPVQTAKPLPSLATTPLPTLTATPLPLPKKERPAATEPKTKTEPVVEAYVTTGVVHYQSEEPVPEKNVSPAPAKEPPSRLPKGPNPTWIQRKIEIVCGPMASYVEVTSPGPKVLHVHLEVRNEDEAKRLSRKIMDMPELAPYEVDLNVDIK